MGQLLLVRHGQASWGADDYDVLSETGWEQSRLLGKALAARGIVPDVALVGGMRRHRETAQGCLGQLDAAPVAVVDNRWDEFDHMAMLDRVPSASVDRKPTGEEFQRWFEAATDRWTGGAHDEDYPEPFSAFTDRIGSALRGAVSGSGTTVVFSSGGPISWIMAELLTEDPGSAGALWRRLNPVCVNSGVTRLVTGRRGTTLVTFNEHAHLDGVPGSLTYR